jgi:predicted transcriptional regulator of viral defense system
VIRATAREAEIDEAPRRGADLDARIVAFANRHHGVIDRAHLLALGASDHVIQRCVASRRLFRIHRGVYSIVPPSMLSRNGRFLAAALAGGEGTLVSYQCAAALHELRSTPSGAVHVTIAGTGTRKIAGARVHCSRCLIPDDLAEIDGIPCTSWARTIVDCAATGTEPEVTRMIEKAQVLQIYDHAVMLAALDRSTGRSGVRMLRAVLADLSDDPAYTRSEFEREFFFLIAEYELPRPVHNAWVRGCQVDFHWPDAKLIVEADDRTTHATPIAFERDRKRDLTLELAGWHVLRISARQLRRERQRVAGAIRAKLARA